MECYEPQRMTSDGKDGSANQPAAPPAGGLFIEYPAELPISARVADIQQALETHAVVIVAGATGSGKTTQLPKIALEVYARRRRQERDARGSDGAEDKRVRRTQQVAVTQPRRIAATSVASRVASELQCQLGKEVGYQIRFDDKSGPETELKFMTDGILLATIQGDPLFKRYHTIIIDEAHERSLTIDFLLGWLKQILPKRPELKVIVSSATIETARFSEFFDGAPVIEVKGRTFPVDVLYEPPDPDLDPREAVANAVESMMSLDSKGDFLVFLPGEREIAETEKILQDRRLFHTEVLPLYGRLSAAEQGKVFTTGVRRRVILATNVAETSLTLPGIVYVIDTGVARLARYDPRTGTTRLQIEQISQASADQRKGRSGRVREGICVRLYDEASFQGRPAFTDPEVRRVGLAGVILRMKSAGLGEIEQFPFLDAPQPRAVAEGYRVLEELGALTAERELTELGRRLAQFPVDPRIARMIIAGADNGCLDEILVLAAALEIRDPRERPRGFEQKADQQHQRFQDKGSDFVSLLKLWSFIGEAKAQGGSHLKRVCQQTYLSFARVREWREVHRQLESTVHEMKLRKGLRREKLEVGEVVHLSLLSGLLSRIGIYEPEKRSYQGARQTRFVLHPSSAMAKQPPAWVMAFEL
ncbi:MAG: ATP-dependent helicase HrpA, partial [Pseudomonadota bacterium]